MTHPALIKANIALYKGERAEASRLLREYQLENPVHGSDEALILWLEANVQTDPDERLRRLYDLIETVELDNPYGQIARDYLYEEEEYARRLKPRMQAFSWRRVAGFVILGSVLIVLVMAGFNLLGNGSRTQTGVTPAPTEATIATPLPDRSRALVADAFTARYADGILQVTTLENGSQRVVNQSGETVSPVAGARFFALRVVFECRRGICETPPEAQLAVRMDNGDIIEVRGDLTIANQESLQPIALGRTTSGWIVFQVPVVNRVEALLITPDNAANQTPEILSIEMPVQQE